MTPVGGVGGGVQSVMQLRQQLIEQSRALQELQAGKPTATPATDEPAGGFAGTLKTALSEVNDSAQRSAELSAAYERGEVTDITSVMLARQESSIAFEATLQVRNKLLSAYQEIMRMGV
ncbi:flagellar hook-basal body complex protein FliE [Sphingomicrobium astaxanthinifaciens]|uniref:flagellar hook-basal body complex protein FliE n=1 Tax=Sphingomicrobium astaxanthinifaciens TaxID=1227949 RepID=UPI001FCA8776|nr:flagellar hook-basal body complex protein FliE [Sphingomicrobium astaxanthinifaciens]MCJ7420368.1 flagellar hook-basal body complex protein FliE [Sphingomicrobium astaxanthinifaciens]